MGNSKSGTARTRRRIIYSASQTFREKGIDGTSVNDLMMVAGLTRGGFYRHFSSKDHLVAEACAHGFEVMVESVQEACSAVSVKKSGSAGLTAFASAFLSEGSRDDRAAGCPFTTIGIELARANRATRHAASDGLRRTVELLAQEFSAACPDTAHSLAVAALAAVVGGLTLANIIDDAELAATVLADVQNYVQGMADPWPAALPIESKNENDDAVTWGSNSRRKKSVQVRSNCVT